jgi:hypothetical protein
MLYAVAELHLPSGQVLHQQVLETCDGELLSFAPFMCENHAMTFVPVVFLKEIIQDGNTGVVLCAYASDATGGCMLLE